MCSELSLVKRHGEKSGSLGKAGLYRGGMNWAQRAIAIADRKGINKTQIGAHVGRNRGWIGKIAAGENSARIDEALKVAELLDVSLDFLFRDEMPWAKPAAGGVGNPYDMEAAALIKMVDALGIGYDEAMRRIANAGEPWRILAAQVTPPPPPLQDSAGDPAGGGTSQKPPRKRRGIQRDG